MVDKVNTGFAKKRLHAAALLALVVAGAMLPRPARSASSTAALGVSLTIIAGCAVSGLPLGSSAQATGSASMNPKLTVGVNCDNGDPYRVEMNRSVMLSPGFNS